MMETILNHFSQYHTCLLNSEARETRNKDETPKVSSQEDEKKKKGEMSTRTLTGERDQNQNEPSLFRFQLVSFPSFPAGNYLTD